MSFNELDLGRPVIVRDPETGLQRKGILIGLHNGYVSIEYPDGSVKGVEPRIVRYDDRPVFDCSECPHYYARQLKYEQFTKECFLLDEMGEDRINNCPLVEIWKMDWFSRREQLTADLKKRKEKYKRVRFA